MTRRRNMRTTTTGRRRTARMPLWGIVALLILAAGVAVSRSTGLGPFAAPVERTPPALPAPTVTGQAVPATPATVTGGVDAIPAYAETARAVRIIDGDTIEVEILQGPGQGERRRVRYVGIDTPEREQPGYVAASEANRRLVEGRTLYLVVDRSDTDAFNRLLRHLYLEDGTHVNAALIRDGWAQPVEYPPDVTHARLFRELAVEAAEHRRGFWSGEASGVLAENGEIEAPMAYAITLREAPIRRGPATRFDARTTLGPDTPLSVYGRTPDGAWLQVRPPSRDGGWIETAAVDLRAPIDAVEVVEP